MKSKTIPKISVLLSIYNEPEEWLRQSIESILAQTYSDFEFIIINDNPKREENKKLLKEYQDLDERVVVIHNEENIGLTKSLNKGLQIAKGKYIARMDGDDISLPKRLKKQIDYLTSNPEVIVCGTQIKKFNSSFSFIKSKLPINHCQITYHLLINSGFAHPTVMIKREALISNDILYDESFKQTQDYKLWVDLIGHGKFSNIDEVLLLYRTSKSQLSYTKKKQQFENAKRCRLICFKKLYPNSYLLTTVKEKNLSFKTIRKFNFNKSENSTLLILLWLSLTRYSLKTAISFIMSGDWRYFSGMQVLAFIKRFIKSPQPLI